MENLNSDLLRTFLAIIDTGSISAGAVRIGRSQTAVSMQIKKLESVLGRPVFERHGRGVSLNTAGEKLEATARQTVSLLDASLAEIKSDELAGLIRLGIPDDRSKTVLSNIVAEFAKSHPRVELVVQCASGATYAQAIAAGKLDVALYEVESTSPHLDVLASERTYWVSSRHHCVHEQDPLPVALFDHDCWWREMALDTLHRSHRDYRVVFSSESVAGVATAIRAGIAVGLLGQSSIEEGFCILSEPGTFQDMHVSKLVLDQRQDLTGSAVRALTEIIRQAFADN